MRDTELGVRGCGCELHQLPCQDLKDFRMSQRELQKVEGRETRHLKGFKLKRAFREPAFVVQCKFYER